MQQTPMSTKSKCGNWRDPGIEDVSTSTRRHQERLLLRRGYCRLVQVQLYKCGRSRKSSKCLSVRMTGWCCAAGTERVSAHSLAKKSVFMLTKSLTRLLTWARVKK